MGILASLLALYDEMTRREPNVRLYTGKVVFPKGALAKWKTKKLTESEKVGAFLDRLAAAKERGERWFDLAIKGDVLLIAAWDWRDDGDFHRALDRALDVAASLQPKGTVLEIARHRGGTAWISRKFAGKKLVIDEGETSWEGKKAQAALAAVAPALETWLRAHPKTRERIARSGRYGYIDREGREIVAPTLAHAYEFSDGLAVVNDGTTRMIDVDGKMLAKKFAGASYFMRGLAPVAPEISNEWGYVDRTGAVKIPATFAQAEAFYGPLALVVSGPFGSAVNRWLTPDGELVGDAFQASRYDPRLRFFEERAWTWRTDLSSFGCVDEQARPAFARRFANIDPFHEGLAAVIEIGETKWGYIDRDGEVVIPPRFDAAYAFTDGRAVVRDGKSHRLIDRSGAFVSGPFASAFQSTLSEGMLPFVGKGRVGFLTKDGDVAIKPRFTEAYGFYEGRAYVAVKGDEVRWGHVDREGAFVVAPDFEWTNRFTDGLAPVKIAGLHGFIDRAGTIVIEPLYKSMQPRFNDGRAWVQLP